MILCLRGQCSYNLCDNLFLFTWGFRDLFSYTFHRFSQRLSWQEWRVSGIDAVWSLDFNLLRSLSFFKAASYFLPSVFRCWRYNLFFSHCFFKNCSTSSDLCLASYFFCLTASGCLIFYETKDKSIAVMMLK